MVWLAATLILAAYQEPATTPAAFDYSKVDRKIRQQPKYMAEPQYAMLLVGESTRIWMALDKSARDIAYPDVLYVDLDADGSLGEDGETFRAKPQDGRVLVFNVGKLVLAEAKFELEDLTVRSYPAEKPPHVQIGFKMNRTVNWYGGYGPEDKDLQFADSPDKAPIVHADLAGPLSFFHVWPEELTKGRKETFMLYVGTSGSGPSSFMAVDENYLDLEKDKIFATVIGRDDKGKEVRRRYQLKEHCWGIRYEGPVWVPPRAVRGTVKVLVELESSTGKKAVPAEFELKLK